MRRGGGRDRKHCREHRDLENPETAEPSSWLWSLCKILYGASGKRMSIMSIREFGDTGEAVWAFSA